MWIYFCCSWYFGKTRLIQQLERVWSVFLAGIFSAISLDPRRKGGGQEEDMVKRTWLDAVCGIFYVHKSFPS